jgi:hypothetical protein
VPSDEPVATAQLALERARQQAGLPELPRSDWTLVSDDGSGRWVYASASWGVELLEDERGWLAVSSFMCG